MPLALVHSIGAMIGRLAWWHKGNARRITEINLQLCFPSMNTAERQNLAKRSLIETGKQLIECAWIWHRPQAQIVAKIREWRGLSLFEDALAENRGVIIVSPHIGNWELCSLPLSMHAPFTYFYRSPRNPAIDPLLIKWRAHLGGQPALLNAGGIRTGLRILKSGGVVGILPDQEPDFENGHFAPFFGESALTMTLLSKLANRSKAKVLMCVCERLSNASGWRVNFLDADSAVSDADTAKAVAAVNRDVERCIALCPEQYVWNYKRFKTLPDGSPRNYQTNDNS
jgi:KDO2-lipid IV(A) lauroyltransferase